MLVIRCPTYSTSLRPSLRWDANLHNTMAFYLASIVKVFIVRSAEEQYIVFIYLAYACDIAGKYFVAFKQYILSDESGCRGV